MHAKTLMKVVIFIRNPYKASLVMSTLKTSQFENTRLDSSRLSRMHRFPSFLRISFPLLFSKPLNIKDPCLVPQPPLQTQRSLHLNHSGTATSASEPPRAFPPPPAPSLPPHARVSDGSGADHLRAERPLCLAASLERTFSFLVLLP